MRLIPKDDGFYDLFSEIASRVTKSTQLLCDLVANPVHLEQKVAAIKELEHQADGITHDVIVRLDESFVTPMDREDIHLLAYRLDNVVDLVDGTARRALMFRVTESPEPVVRLTDVLRRAAAEVEAGVRELRKRKEVVKRAQAIKVLEEEGDAIFGEALGNLFDGSMDPLSVIKWKELYDRIENAIDECEDVANVLESISLKNS